MVYSSRKLEIDSGSFVEDFLNAIMVLLHALCAGLAGGCPICTAAAAAAQSRFDDLDTMMRECALIFSIKGDMSVAQHHVILGIIFDTHLDRLFVTEEKFHMDLWRKIMELLTSSPQGMAKLRGKSQHQFRCFEVLVPFLCALISSSGGLKLCMNGIKKRRFLQASEA